MSRLGDLFEIGAGKTMSAAARGGANKTPFLRTSNVLWDEIDLSSVDEMAIPEHELPGKLLRAGDMLVCEGGEIGRAAIWESGLHPVSFQNHLHRLRPAASTVDARFYVYFLQSAFTQLGIFEGSGNKTTIPNLSRGRLGDLAVPVPPPDEQRAIAQTLGIVRRAIRTQVECVDVSVALKRATMRELFTCGLRGGEQRETEIGLVPERWEVVEFQTVRRRLQYGTSVRSVGASSGFPVLRIPNIELGRVNTEELKYSDMTDGEARNFRLEGGDLIFIRTNGVLERLGACAVYAGEPDRALFASYLIRAQLCHDRIVPRYCAFFFGSERGTALVAGRATPAADGKYNLNTGAIDSLLLPLPPTLDEQHEIVGVLDAIDRKIDLHKRKKAVLEELFKALLHKLMTGEIRVADLDLAALDSAPAAPAVATRA